MFLSIYVITFVIIAIIQSSNANNLNYVAFSFDTSEIIGNFWSAGSALSQLKKERFQILTKALIENKYSSSSTTAIIRVGGTDADNVFWNVSAPGKPKPKFTGDKYTLNSTRLEVLCNYIHLTNLSLVLGLNGGIHHRFESNKSWNPAPAKSLLEYLTNPISKCYGHLYAVELTNEPNLFLESQKFYLSGKQLALDYAKLKELILELNLTEVKIAGIDVAYQFPIGLGPVVPTTKYFLEHGGGKYLDILTWHWYALESSRCPFKGKFSPATQSTAMSLNTLNKGDRWNIKLNELQAKYAPNSELWLGEMSLVSCGGAENITNTFCGSFWYIDELCRRALQGNKVIVRQTITGSRYGMIDATTLNPLPDYWTSLLYNTLVGANVHNVTAINVISKNDNNNNLRAYAFSNKNNPKQYQYTIVLINIDPMLEFKIDEINIDGVDISTKINSRMEYHIRSTSSNTTVSNILSNNKIKVNNVTLVVGADNVVPSIVDLGAMKNNNLKDEPLSIDRLSFAFILM